MSHNPQSPSHGEPTKSQDPGLRFAETAIAEGGTGPEPPPPEHRPAALLTATAPAPIEGEGRALTGRAPLRVGSTLKHYEIIRELGQGGMGTVFLARDTKLGRLVAIKVLLEHSGQGAERFLVEARATARCTHENIVVIHEVDEIHGAPYMVLEYLEGRTLRAFMLQRERPGASEPPAAPGVSFAPVPSSLAVELMTPVVRALVCSHKLGIVHRDLKPENIFLTDAGPVKVLDFGIAKQLGAREISRITSAGEPIRAEPGVTQKGALLGTLPYMSPEQWRSEDIDHRSDIWAVGVILHELCTGAHPLLPLSMSRLERVADLDEPMPSVLEERPDLGALGAVIDRCLRKRKAERVGSAEELLAALEALSPGRREPALGSDESPFAGLSAFQEADAARFFGREREVSAMTGRLRNLPLVAVAGPSGAGKSSLVRAGVIPALKRSGERWEAFIVRPGRRPLAALADVLAQVFEARFPDELVAAFRTSPGLLGAELRARCRRQGGRHRVLLFVDQFEELYTLGADPGERAAFVTCLEGAADDASSPLRVMLSIRADFLDRLAEDRKLMTEVTRGLSFLPPLGREGLREALTRPVEATGYRFESEDMVDGMLGALLGTRSPLPLLQFTAAKLWEARDRDRRLLTRDSYEKLGGVAGALSTHADAVLAGLSASDQRLCRAVFLRLCTAERTRAVVSLDELRGLAEDAGAVEQVVHHLVDARLLLLDASGEREGTTVELVHESLIERWARLKQWLDESEQDAQFLGRLRAAAQQWEASGEAEGLLWRDRAAREAEAWLEGRRAERGAGAHIGLGKREERYLLSVVALSQRARRRRRWVTTGVFVALSVIALVVSYLAVRANQEAQRARNATRMATARELQGDPTTEVALLREVEPPGVPRGWSDLARGALHSKIALVVLAHQDSVRSAAWSADGQWLVTASEDKTAQVWRADGTGEPRVLRGHEGRVNAAAFSPDGQRIVTASEDRTARVWSADGTGEPRVLRGHEDKVYRSAFSPDGQRIVTASLDSTARVWRADGASEPLVVLEGHTGGIYSAAWSPDGQRIVTASSDRTARVWSANEAGEPVVLQGHEGEVDSAAFSPDGQRIITASEDKTARVWSADGAGEPQVLRGHAGWVTWAAWSPDGERIVTASDDKTVRVWSADRAGEPRVLRGHAGTVFSTAFSPDGERIVTASSDTTARVWNAGGAGEPQVLRGHEGWVVWAAWSPDGQRIVTASADKTARVWRADGTGEPLVLRGHEDEVGLAEFSPDGQRIVTASADKTARVWSADGTGEPLVLRGHGGGVLSAEWSPDGQRIVTASGDKTARVWRADGAGEPVVLRGHEGWVASGAWSPDGQRIVTASLDKTVRVWSADGTGEPMVLRGHERWVYSAAWSPDGQRIVSGSVDKTARVWSDLAELRGADDPKLWAATSYCLSIELRMKLLNVTEAAARAEQQACQRRVAEARAAP